MNTLKFDLISLYFLKKKKKTTQRYRKRKTEGGLEPGESKASD